MRIGHGYDVHAFTKGDHLILGGVRIPHHQGIRAHSDGDLVLHAVMDALLGAAALGDIGHHFPDHDPAFENANSRTLLQQVVAELDQRDYQVGNLDVTIIAQSPKLAPHLAAMKAHLSEDLHTPLSQINLKATTTEHLGYIGREEGLAAHAVVLLTSTAKSYASK